MSKHPKPKVAILFHRIGPYHYSRLKEAGRFLRVFALEMTDSDNVYKWDLVSGQEFFERSTLFPGANIKSEPASKIWAITSDKLDDLQPDAVAIPGWSDRISLAALKWCENRQVPAVMMSDSTAWDFHRTTLRETIKKRMIRLSAAALVAGQPHADYICQLGMDRNLVFLGYDTVDNDYFATASSKFRDHTEQNRIHLGLPSRFFLASARFVEKKNLFGLLRSYALYLEHVAGLDTGNDFDDSRKPWSLVLLGDGYLKPNLDKLICDLRFQDRVILPGFKQYEELPAYYGLASAFIHASTTEQWGLVVNEAMASGLPVLVSNRCGCAADLVQEGVNGFTFDPYNIKEIADKMYQITQAQDRLTHMGRASRKIISQWGPERFADGLCRAVEIAMQSKLHKASLADKILLELLMRRNNAA